LLSKARRFGTENFAQYKELGDALRAGVADVRRKRSLHKNGA
jgi:hypothetical protein